MQWFVLWLQCYVLVTQAAAALGTQCYRWPAMLPVPVPILVPVPVPLTTLYQYHFGGHNTMLSLACYAAARSIISVGGKILASSSAASAAAAASSAAAAAAASAVSSSSAATAVWGTQCYPATALSLWEDLC